MIEEALKKLDPENDNHWTASGKPRLDTVRMFTSNSSLTREDLDTLAPGFDRDYARANPSEETSEVSVEDEVELSESAEDKDEFDYVLDELEPKRIASTAKKASDDELQLMLDRHQDSLAEMRKHLNALAKVVEAAVEVETVLINEQTARKPKTTNASTIRAYLNSQNKLRSERTERLKAVQELLAGK